MRIRTWILGIVIGLLPFYSCNDEEDNGTDGNETYANESPLRVKRITGERQDWGQYELQFNYRPDGLLEQVWRFGNIPYTETRDTLGEFSVEYDLDYYNIAVIDYFLSVK